MPAVPSKTLGEEVAVRGKAIGDSGLELTRVDGRQCHTQGVGRVSMSITVSGETYTKNALWQVCAVLQKGQEAWLQFNGVKEPQRAMECNPEEGWIKLAVDAKHAENLRTLVYNKHYICCMVRVRVRGQVLYITEKDLANKTMKIDQLTIGRDYALDAHSIRDRLSTSGGRSGHGGRRSGHGKRQMVYARVETRVLGMDYFKGEWRRVWKYRYEHGCFPEDCPMILTEMKKETNSHKCFKLGHTQQAEPIWKFSFQEYKLIPACEVQFDGAAPLTIGKLARPVKAHRRTPWLPKKLTPVTITEVRDHGMYAIETAPVACLKTNNIKWVVGQRVRRSECTLAWTHDVDKNGEPDKKKDGKWYDTRKECTEETVPCFEYQSKQKHKHLTRVYENGSWRGVLEASRTHLLLLGPGAWKTELGEDDLTNVDGSPLKRFDVRAGGEVRVKPAARSNQGDGHDGYVAVVLENRGARGQGWCENRPDEGYPGIEMCAEAVLALTHLHRNENGYELGAAERQRMVAVAERQLRHTAGGAADDTRPPRDPGAPSEAGSARSTNGSWADQHEEMDFGSPPGEAAEEKSQDRPAVAGEPDSSPNYPARSLGFDALASYRDILKSLDMAVVGRAGPADLPYWPEGVLFQNLRPLPKEVLVEDPSGLIHPWICLVGDKFYARCNWESNGKREPGAPEDRFLDPIFQRFAGFFERINRDLAGPVAPREEEAGRVSLSASVSGPPSARASSPAPPSAATGPTGHAPVAACDIDSANETPTGPATDYPVEEEKEDDETYDIDVTGDEPDCAEDWQRFAPATLAEPQIAPAHAPALVQAPPLSGFTWRRSQYGDNPPLPATGGLQTIAAGPPVFGCPAPPGVVVVGASILAASMVQQPYAPFGFAPFAAPVPATCYGYPPMVPVYNG